jgi:hypothetical protein
MTEVLRSMVKFLDGPESGNTVMGYPGEPPEQITVFRTQMVAEGSLICKEDDGDYLRGDLIYRKVSRSALFDNEAFTGHPNVMPGCAYKFVRAVPDEECYQEPKEQT